MVTSEVDLGGRTPLLGLTQYFLGFVVLTLKPTWSSDLLDRRREHDICWFNSNEKQISAGSMERKFMSVAIFASGRSVDGSFCSSSEEEEIN